jgi:hypothetical protein
MGLGEEVWKDVVGKEVGKVLTRFVSSRLVVGEGVLAVRIYVVLRDRSSLGWRRQYEIFNFWSMTLLLTIT